METTMVKLKDLKVDPEYQRKKKPKHIRDIANNFDKEKAGSLVIGEREDGQRYIIDGQQRTEGALIAGITELPGLIIKTGSSGKQREAEIYNAINKNRKNQTARENFKARLATGDEDAQELSRILKSEGFLSPEESLSGKTRWGHIQAITSLEAIHKKYGSRVVLSALRLVNQVWLGQQDAFRGPVLLGLMYFLGENREVVNTERMARLLSKITPREIFLEANSRYENNDADNRNKSAIKTYIRIWNKGLRTNRIET